MKFVLLLLRLSLFRAQNLDHLRQPQIIESDCVKQWKLMTPSSQNYTKERRGRPVIFQTTPSELHVTLVVDVERFESTYVSFTTRTYNGSIPAPTIKVCPGDRLVLHIYNKLGQGHENRTNVHVHGLVMFICHIHSCTGSSQFDVL